MLGVAFSQQPISGNAFGGVPGYLLLLNRTNAEGIATPADPDKISVNSGNNQYGEVYQPLPVPFVVTVTDLGANVIAGEKIEFTVVKGGGHFPNGEKSFIATTDSDGRATAHLVAGGLQGFDAQVVTAKLANSEFPIRAGFSLTTFVPGAPGNTRVSGIVTDTEDSPLAGVTVRVDGTTRQAVTDAKGKFLITEAPVGPVHLVVDGSTIEGSAEYPTLSYNLVTVSGVENPLTAPVYMVKLNTASMKYAGREDVTLTLAEIPGFALEVPAGSVTFPDGAREGYLSVTVVNSSKVPMPPPNGMQPQFIVTIQPTGAMFDPPAKLTLPNVDGYAPGRQVEMFSYDHDLEEFVAIGLGTVAKDGKTVTSNPGVGVVKAGWHCGAQAGGNGCCASKDRCNEECAKPNSGCDAGCSIDYDKVLEKQKLGNCKTETCGGGEHDKDNRGDVAKDILLEDCKAPACDEQSHPTFVPDESQKPSVDIILYDCKKPGCDGMSPNLAKDPKDSDIKEEDKKCNYCEDGEKIKKENAYPDDQELFYPEIYPEEMVNLIGAWGSSNVINEKKNTMCSEYCKNGKTVYYMHGYYEGGINILIDDTLTGTCSGVVVIMPREAGNIQRTLNHETNHAVGYAIAINTFNRGVKENAQHDFDTQPICAEAIEKLDLERRRSFYAQTWHTDILYTGEKKYSTYCSVDGLTLVELPNGLVYSGSPER